MVDDYCPKCGIVYSIHEGDGSCPLAKDEIVDLIASGYEWTCPSCEKLNEEMEIPKDFVICECGQSFRICVTNFKNF